MRKTLLLIASGLAALATTAQAEPANPRGQAELARMIAGRVAGAPVSCINLHEIDSSRIIDGTAIVYTMRGGRIYVNTPSNGAQSLNSSDIMVTDTHIPQLCNVDIVRLIDNGTHMSDGWIGLSQFVPYDRPRNR
jgi:hypothetical protein